MADTLTNSTSSQSLDKCNGEQPDGQMQQQEKENLPNTLNENYNYVKMRQQKYTELSAKLGDSDNKQNDKDDDNKSGGVEQQAAAMQGAKLLSQHLTKLIQNKLKRKKKLSISLTSVSDMVNQEKRTRIEGMNLNCRGKLLMNANGVNQPQSASAPLTPTHHSCVTGGAAAASGMAKMEKVLTKPPIPPTKADRSQSQQQLHQQNVVKVPPPRLKRKLEENVSTIQKLNALTEQMRLEISDLKQNLSSERGAVRVLRAQNESETRKWKTEVKKLQSTLDVLKKVNSSSAVSFSSKKQNESCDVSTVTIGPATSGQELQRLTNDILALKEANRTLEERNQIHCDADRRKAADIRELKDSYEIRLTQLSKSAKTEISRLLEEIKTKERNIGQLKKEVQTLHNKPLSRNATTNNNSNAAPIMTTTTTTQRNPTPIRSNRNNRRKDSRNVQNPNEMKKLKDVERNNNNNCNNVTNKNSTINVNNAKNNGKENDKTNSNNNNNIMNNNNNKCFINTTCGDKEYHSMPHEITERILGTHNDVHEYRSKDTNSDSDSALSSAPPSISPQPPPAGMHAADIWQTIRNYSTDLEKVQKDLEILQKENESLQTELNLAKEQIIESEKTALEANNNNKVQQLLERIKYLEKKENKLQKESHELREQNELLEFRIIELEESNDKWSLQSNASPDNKDMWSDTTKESEDAMIIYNADHTDSGVTSPHSHHHIDDRINTISPCDLNLLVHLTNEHLRQRLTSMLKKSTIEEDDKQCVQQVLTLIQNFEAISHGGSDSMPTSSDEASSLDLVKSRISDYSSASSPSSIRSVQAPLRTTTPSTPADSYSLHAKPKSSANSRIVATVLPYNSNANTPTSTPADSPARKGRSAWNLSSLTESGVFEGDFGDNTVFTQTDPEDFGGETPHHPTKDLCAEIQKLNKFREKIEECVSAKSACAAVKVPVPVPTSILSPNLSDQKRIQYYKERLDLLESKILIYESSGDLQAKRLADRLQREIQLESLVKDLRDRVDFLETENSSLEEEKCEFEEAENDTRLRLQRLEIELEILSQRNIELEMSREALSAKLKDCRAEGVHLRKDISQSHTHIRNLEEDNQRVKENFNFLHSILPVLVLFHSSISTKQTTPSTMGNSVATFNPVAKSESLAQFERDEVMLCNRDVQPSVMSVIQETENHNREVHYLHEQIESLRRQITDLNARHYEAMECADSHWVDIEKEYKEREAAYRSKEASLKQKISKLQDCLRDDSRAANEKIMQLEDSERNVKLCLQKVSREHRDLLEEHCVIVNEYQRVKDDFDQLKKHFEGPGKESLETVKSRNRCLADEIRLMHKALSESETRSKNEFEQSQSRFMALNKEFLQIEVTNGELKEEVATLENQILRLQKSEKEYIDKIRCLCDEIRSKEDMCAVLEKKVAAMESLKVGNFMRTRNFSADDKGRRDNESPASTSTTVQSLAQELNGSPVKRAKREEVNDLRTASRLLGGALSSFEECEDFLPTTFHSIAKDVKKLADSLLGENPCTDDEGNRQQLDQQQQQQQVNKAKLFVTEITRI